MASQPAEPAPSIRWGWVTFSVAVGALLIAASVYTDIALNWDDIWPSVLLEVGASVALAGFLFGLERMFIREASRQTQNAVRGVEERTEQLAEQVARQQTRLDELTGATRARRTERHRELDEAVAQLEQEVSYQVVREAIQVADRLDATGNDFQVRCSLPIDALRMRVQIVALEPGSEHGASAREGLHVQLWSRDPRVPHLPSEILGGGTPIDEVTVRITEAIERKNLDASPATFDPHWRSPIFEMR